MRLTLATSHRAYLIAVSAWSSLATAVDAQVSKETAAIRGQVVTPTRKPIADVQIDVLGQAVSGSTDAEGKFLLRGIAPGELLVVRFRRIGYNVEYFRAALASGEGQELEIMMTPGAYELPEINVIARNAKPIEYAWTTRYDDFFRRKAVGLGVYRDREYIERWRPLQTANLLAGIPGVRLRFNGGGSFGASVELSGCHAVSVFIDGVRQLPFGGAVSQLASGGQRRAATARQISEMLDRVIPSQIEMMEVYRGRAEMQAEFIDGDSCAAIAIWTR